MLPSPAALTSALGLDVTRLEPTRPGDDDSLANGNWHLWTRDGEHHILWRAERGELLAGLHRDLRGLDLGPRPGFFETADLEAMEEFQDWDAGVAALREQRAERPIGSIWHRNCWMGTSGLRGSR